MTIDRRKWTRTLAACMVGGASLAGSAEKAENAESTARDAASDETEKAVEAPRPPKAKEADGETETKRTAAAEVFVPSEDISEDFAVPFPVDI